MPQTFSLAPTKQYQQCKQMAGQLHRPRVYASAGLIRTREPLKPLNEGPHIQDLSGPRSRQDLGLEAELGVLVHVCGEGASSSVSASQGHMTPGEPWLHTQLLISLTPILNVVTLFLCTFLHLHSSASHAPHITQHSDSTTPSLMS